jgi:hypothetical protein
LFAFELDSIVQVALRPPGGHFGRGADNNVCALTSIVRARSYGRWPRPAPPAPGARGSDDCGHDTVTSATASDFELRRSQPARKSPRNSGSVNSRLVQYEMTYLGESFRRGGEQETSSHDRHARLSAEADRSDGREPSKATGTNRGESGTAFSEKRPRRSVAGLAAQSAPTTSRLVPTPGRPGKATRSASSRIAAQSPGCLFCLPLAGPR